MSIIFNHIHFSNRVFLFIIIFCWICVYYNIYRNVTGFSPSSTRHRTVHAVWNLSSNGSTRRLPFWFQPLKFRKWTSMPWLNHFSYGFVIFLHLILLLFILAVQQQNKFHFVDLIIIFKIGVGDVICICRLRHHRIAVLQLPHSQKGDEILRCWWRRKDVNRISYPHLWEHLHVSSGDAIESR